MYRVQGERDDLCVDKGRLGFDSECFKNYVDTIRDMAAAAVRLLEVFTDGLGLWASIQQPLAITVLKKRLLQLLPPCREPSTKAMGVGRCLTILYHVKVGGLQLRGEDGNWLAWSNMLHALTIQPIVSKHIF